MKKTLLRGLAATGAALLVTAAYSPAVSAQTTQSSTTAQTFQANLTTQNKSGASGTATLTLSGNNLTVDLRATGLSPNLAHAQHIHVGGAGACPTPAADADKDGFVSSKEGEPAIGPIRVSLTTSGDVSSGSALTVDRFPKANAQGVVTYKRTFALPSGVTAADMRRASIELHGIASLFNNRSQYDGDKKSELDNKLPFETTVPAACGVLTATPAGGPDTGLGSTTGIEAPAALAFGVTALVAAAVLYLYSHRPTVRGRI